MLSKNRKSNILLRVIAIGIVCLFVFNNVAYDVSLNLSHIYKTHTHNLSIAAKWDDILSPEKGDKGMIHIALTAALEALYQQDRELFSSLDYFKGCVAKADEYLFNLPSGLQFLFRETEELTSGRYATKCRLTGHLSGPRSQQTYHVVFGKSTVEISRLKATLIDVYTEEEYESAMSLLEKTSADKEDLDVNNFDDIRKLSAEQFRETIRSINLRVIGEETHTIVLSNDDLDYVIKVRNVAKDINDSFDKYREYHDRQGDDISLAEYFIADDLNLQLGDRGHHTFTTAVVQEKVNILSTELDIDVINESAEEAKEKLNLFSKIHKNLAHHGLLDKLFTVAGLSSHHRIPRRYLTNIGYSQRKEKWVHIDCADLTEVFPDNEAFQASFEYIREWFPYKNDAELSKHFDENVIPELGGLVVDAVLAAKVKQNINKTFAEVALSSLEIPTNAYNRYKLIVPFEFFGNDDREFNVHEFLYGDRFYLDYISDKDKTRYIDKVLASAAEFKGRTIALVPDDTTVEDLERLNQAGVRFIRVNLDALLHARIEEEGYKHILHFQQNTYAMMLLARRISEINPESSIYRTLSFFIETHFNLKDVEVSDYIKAIVNNQVAILINGILAFRPAEAYDMPEYYEIAPALTSA